MTFGLISIAETTTDIITLDTPIEELNGLTLNEVFRDNNELNGKTLNAVNSTILSIIDGLYTISIDILANANRIETTVNFAIPTNLYYMNASIYALYNNLVELQIGGTGVAIVPTSNEWFTYSAIHTAVNNTRARFYHRTGTNYTVSDIYKQKDLLILNLTSLGLTSLTKTQLDDYFDIYINGGYYEYDAILNDLDMTDFIIISSSFVLWLWFMRFVKGVL
jgi:hypothetical protein